MDSGTLTRSEADLRPDDGVIAGLTFVQATTLKPYVYMYPPPPGRPERFAPQVEKQVLIRNARLRPEPFSLDREGFIFRPHATAVADLYDEAAIERGYYPEVVDLVREATGAGRVLVFDHTLRTADETKPDGTAVRAPVLRVHNDYTPKSAAQRIRDLLPDEAERLLQRRYAYINVWRPIIGPLEHLPLALCDAQSIEPEDAVTNDLIYRDRIGETYLLRYNARQRWFYVPRMTRDEVALIKCFDSDPARARFSAHSAFVDPNTPADARPRASIEVRTIAFF
jgi:hypothetical protein